MQTTSIFSRTLGGRGAPLWPAISLSAMALLLVFVKMTTDEGLAWAVSIEVLAQGGVWWLTVVGLVLWAIVLGMMIVMLGVSAADDLVLVISGGVSALLLVMVCLLLSFIGRMPTDSINNYMKIQRAVANANSQDPVANQLRQRIKTPTHAGLAAGVKLIEQSLQGPEMERAMVAASIIGIDDFGVVKRAKMRGWMTPREIKVVRDKVVEFLRSQGQNKSMAWQAAAIALVDRQALSEPLTIQTTRTTNE